jgi:hypothetical protein
MATVYKYRIFCTTDNKYEYVWADENIPTQCPVNSNHSIDPSQTTIVEEISSNDVNIVSDATKKVDSDNNQKVTIQPRLGSGTTIITHNFGDPCTWYQNSVEVVDEILTPKVPGVYDVYKCSKTNIIDIEHGRITFDERVDQKYKIRVKVNDVVVTSGFTFNYEDGEITFATPLTSNDVVKLKFWYATDSVFTIAPLPGKKLKIEQVETQFSVDVDMAGKTEARFEEWGYNPNNLPNKMMYKRTRYKNIAQFVDESNNKFCAELAPMDNLTKTIRIFVWEYPVARVMKYSQGAEVRISMYDVATGLLDKPIKNKDGGRLERATVAFYCVSEDE